MSAPTRRPYARVRRAAFAVCLAVFSFSARAAPLWAIAPPVSVGMQPGFPPPESGPPVIPPSGGGPPGEPPVGPPGGGPSVPELDPGAMAGGLTLAVGGALVLTDKARRRARP